MMLKYIFLLLLSASAHASNILDYGCVGDNTFDNVVCINNALSAAAPGTTVSVPVGIFRVSDTIHVPEKVTFSGENLYGSVIKTLEGFPSGAAVVSMTDDDGVCLMTAVKRLRIQALHADIGVYSNCVNEHSGLYSVNIQAAKNIGVLFEKTEAAGPSNYSLVDVNVYTHRTPDPTDRGIVLDSQGAGAWRIEGITITTTANESAGVGSVAMDVDEAHNIVLNSIFFEGWDIGIRLGDTRNVTIINARGHHSMNNGGSALLITSSARYTMVISLDSGGNPPGYKVIDDQNLGTVNTGYKRVSIYVSE